MDIKKQVEKYAAMKRSQVRQKDYEITDEKWIRGVLTQGAYGVLATSHEGQPFATPVNYLYVEEANALYFHGARVGRTRANMALNPRVCFNVSEMGRLTPAEKSSDFGVEYKSVTVFGNAELVEDEKETIAGLLGLMAKYFPEHVPGKDYPMPLPEEIKRTAVYKIKIEEWSAKELAEDEDYPGAFGFPPIRLEVD
jgi:nitroimidazol reductase NimA-like FMN-containing flavoprotein (pyridoxamine 5'-phosphate oxidase superfamily)